MSQYFYLTNASPRATQPSGVKVPLLKSQLASLHACQQFEDNRGFDRTLYMKTIHINTNIGILADITGYGKTLVILSLVSTRKCPEKGNDQIFLSYHCGGNVTITKDQDNDYVPITLLVAPNKLIQQWEKEVKKTNLKYCIVPPTGTEIDWDVDIIFCRSSRYNFFMTDIADGLYFYRTIIDEVDSICISSMESPRSDYIWLVTATPETIPYISNNGWLKNNFAKRNTLEVTCFGVGPTLYQLLSIRCDPQFARSCYPIPPIDKKFISCWTPAHIKIIQDYIPNNIQSMLNGGDLVGAVKAMGGGEHSTFNIIDIIKNRFQLRIEQCNLAIVNINAAVSYTVKQKEYLVEKQLENITQIEKDSQEFVNRINNVNQEQCPICYDSIKNLCMTPCCNSFFCQSCASSWFNANRTCPMCRHTVNINKLIIHNPNITVTDKRIIQKKPPKLTKENQVLKILKDNPKSSFLIFSDHDRTGDLLYAKLVDNNVAFQKLQGHPGTIKKALDASETGKIKALFMNARKDGAGLNMPWIDNIIIYHKLSDSVLTQVIGRTSRIGQKKAVCVWFLEYEDEYTTPPNTILFDGEQGL